jgi:catechol 2,3-dioxygenase-like lactoylglutathione lyase family enzyme
MIRVKLMSIIVNDQNKARTFYTEKLGFAIKHDIPMGGASWLTLVAPDDPNGVELLLEPAGMPAAVEWQKAIYASGIPLAQLYTSDIMAEYAHLKEGGVALKSEPKSMGPTKFVDFDDTCGNFIRLVEG